eukprot:gene18064-23711_t
MDASNLATVFAPTLMRSRDADNAAKFLSEVGFSSIILLHLIQNFESVLATNNRMRSISNASFTPDILVDTIIQRNPLNRSNRNSVVTMQSLESIRDGINHITLLENDSIDGNDVSVNIPSNEPLNNAIDEIQSGLSSAMLESDNYSDDIKDDENDKGDKNQSDDDNNNSDISSDESDELSDDD